VLYPRRWDFSWPPLWEPQILQVRSGLIYGFYPFPGLCVSSDEPLDSTATTIHFLVFCLWSLIRKQKSCMNDVNFKNGIMTDSWHSRPLAYTLIKCELVLTDVDFGPGGFCGGWWSTFGLYHDGAYKNCSSSAAYHSLWCSTFPPHHWVTLGVSIELSFCPATGTKCVTLPQQARGHWPRTPPPPP
jgi:hypothetical protein